MGRGSSGIESGAGWKKQLRAAAKKGEMPSYIVGDRSQQAKVFEEIDKLYPMPDTNARIIDQGNAVWVQMGDKVTRASYPSGESASEAEKRGVLKKVLYNFLNKG